jgi:hypothetical protein
MNIHMAQGDGRDLPSSLTGASARSSGARSKGSDTRARSSGSDRRASVPRPVKGCGDSCTDMSVNVTQLISRRARRARRRRDKERRERALSRSALDEQRQQRAGQQQQQQRRAAVPRPAKGRGVSCALMNKIERTKVTHSSSGLCEYPPVPRPVKGRGYSCTNVNYTEQASSDHSSNTSYGWTFLNRKGDAGNHSSRTDSRFWPGTYEPHL